MPEAPETPAGTEAPARQERRGGATVLGLVFVALGVLFLVDEAWPDFLSWKYVWPLALIAVGAAILLRPRR
jgi:MYXO-CTERM domain-containing protein